MIPATRPAMDRRTGLRVMLCCLGVLLPLSSAAAALPQDHEYQRVLRDYLAQFAEEDYEVQLEDLTFQEEWVESDEELHRLWLALRYESGAINRFDRSLHDLPSMRGIKIAADNFLLSTIESDEQVRMTVGSARHPGAFPGDNAWWASWDYPGNPYNDSQALRNRAFTSVAVEMIMLDHLHESGKHWVDHGHRSDFLGGHMIWLTYVYHVVKDDLPAEVQAAYETGLGKFMDRLTEWGPTNVNSNMDTKSLVGLVYLVKALEEGPMVDQARAYVERNLDTIMHPAGIIRDARDGIEASYNGIALQYLVRATTASHWPELMETLERKSDLKAHMTLPEPDGENYFGPSNFSQRTTPGHPNDQHAVPQRDIGAAMLTDDATYLMFGGRRGRVRERGAPGRQTMLEEVRRGVEHMNDLLEPSDRRLEPWEPNHWGSTIASWAHDYYVPGFYRKLVELDQADDPLIDPPFARRDEQFIRVFPDPALEDVNETDRDTFLITRFNDYGAIFDASSLTGYRPPEAGNGFSGGTLSAFWTPEAGSIILGRMPDRPAEIDWSQWRQWPVHAMSGTTAEGDVFTSARLRRRVAEVEFETDDERAVAVMRGPIGAQHDESRTAQNEGVTGMVQYQRRLELTSDGVSVETRIDADGTDRARELYEIIPLFVKEVRHQEGVGHRVRFRQGDSVVDADDDFVENVTAVHIERFDGEAVITFDQPRRVRVAPEPWTTTYMSGVKTHNLMIDLLEAEGEAVPMPSETLRYRVAPVNETGAATLGPRFTGDAAASPSTPLQRRAGMIEASRRGEAGLPALERALHDEVSIVRLAAVRGLGVVGEAGVPALTSALEHEDEDVRSEALLMMHELGATTPDRLAAALEDPSEPVREMARRLVAETVLARHWRFMPDLDEPIEWNAELRGEAAFVDDGPSGHALAIRPDLEERTAQNALRIASHPRLSPAGPFTIEMWIRPRGHEHRRAFLLDKMLASRFGKDYMIVVTGLEDRGHRFEVTLGFGEDADVATYRSEWLDDFRPQQWHHLVFVYDGEGSGRIHFNGRLVGESTVAGKGGIAVGDRPLSIGDRSVSYYRPFQGYIDRVRLYDRAIEIDYEPHE